MYKRVIHNHTCYKCKFTFPNSISNGAIAAHNRLCKSKGTVLELREPNIPSDLIEIYHGDISEMPGDVNVYSDGPDPYEMRMIFHNASQGEQEAAFAEVVLQMENLVDEETSLIQGDVCTTYKDFQETVLCRENLMNPLEFRGNLNRNELDTVHGIFLFIRKYQLSTKAGT
jgi:hypothetical protein